MSDFDTLALYDALPAEERDALAAALKEQPALAAAFSRWRSLRAGVRAGLARDLPDRALLVLYALADDADALSDDERRQLDAARPALDAALDKHPGLVAAVRRIRDDRDAFEAAWSETVPETTRRTPLRRAETRRQPAAEDRPALRDTRLLRWPARIAAVVAVVAFAGVLTMLALRDAGWETVAGGQTVTLADGSTVDLADGARLQLSDDETRQARLLGGEALFRIVHDEAHPFELTTPNAEVTVLGTTFSVQATDVQTEVMLIQGAVSLAPRATPEKAVRLAPGQTSTVLALDAPTAPAPANLAAIDWTDAVFARGMLAAEVARQLSARFETPVALDAALGAEPVVGEFGADGLDDALAKLALALGGTVEADGPGFRITE